MADQWIDTQTGLPVSEDAIHPPPGKYAGIVKTPKEVQSNLAYALTHPAETAKGIGKGLAGYAKGNVGPLAGQIGGEAAGTALGGALAPETGGLSVLIPILLGATGAGLGNVAATKTLPPAYGGNPAQSATSAFLWGAVPSLVGQSIPAAMGAGLRGRAAAASAEDTAAFEKEAQAAAKSTREGLAEGIKGPAPTDEAVRNVGRVLGAPGQYFHTTGLAAQPLTGEARTQATDLATNMVLGPIDRMRRKLGEPIGNAYKALKGNASPISDSAASDIADAARQVNEDLIAPAPAAKAAFAKIRSYVPFGVEGESDIEGVDWPKLAQLLQKSKEGQKVEATNRELAVLMPKEATSSTKILGKPPTLDELREVRQVITEKLRSAKGGDVHALLNLQQVIDKHLMDYLPEDIGAMRTSYRGFIKNYDWRDLNRLRRSGTPEQVSDWLFSRDKSVVNEVIGNATPAEKDTYKQLFAQRILSNVDANLPAEAQSAALRKELQPYIANGSVRALYGDATNKHLVDMIYLPLRRAETAKSLASPAGQKLYDDAFMRAAKAAGKADREAAEAGYRAFYEALPPAQQKTLDQVATIPRGPAEPVLLPSPQKSLAGALTPKGRGMYVPRFAIASGIGSLGLMAAGAGAGIGGTFMIRAGLGFGALAAGSMGYRALMGAGGADLAAKMFLNPDARAVGSAAFKTLVKIGARKLQQEKEQQANAP